MSQVTIDLSDDLLDRAERLAALAHRDVRDVLADAVAVVLPPMDAVGTSSQPVSDLSDEEVLDLTTLRLTQRQNDRLTDLLDRQQSGTLAEPERAELLTLMQTYESRLLRQSEALAEAVRRKLREPLAP